MFWVGWNRMSCSPASKSVVVGYCIFLVSPRIRYLFQKLPRHLVAGTRGLEIFRPSVGKIAMAFFLWAGVLMPSAMDCHSGSLSAPFPFTTRKHPSR